MTRRTGTWHGWLSLALLLLGQGPLTAAANSAAGAWSPVASWPLIAVHAVLLPDGRVLSYGTDGSGRQTGYFIYDVWDPAAGLGGGHLTLPNSTGTDLFCSAQLVLPQGGQVFIAGGDNWTGSDTTNTGNNNSNLFDYGNATLSRNANMQRPRWYATATTLLNGEIYVQGGSGGSDRPEVRAASGSFRLLSGADTSRYDNYYPRNFIAPDGRVFGYDRTGAMYYVNPAGTGSITVAGQFSGPTGEDASAAMFRPGRILQFGGNSGGAVVIDINGSTPVVTQTQSPSSQRRLVTATLLPNGQVLATGGSTAWNELTGVNNSAEIWNPVTGQWTRGASGNRARLYHSTALLLPDGRVLVAGGGAPGPLNNTNAELYSPPYLYDASGAAAARPAIESAPSSISIGGTFAVDWSAAPAISRVVLVKTGSATHGWNMDQRFLELTFTGSGSRLMVQAPTRAADAPPGYYLLFVLNGSGVPSVARIIRLNVAATASPALTPVLANPGAQTTEVGVATSLQLSATDPNGDTLGYGASGLPPGLNLNSATGRITGTPTTAGAYNVVVAASDGVNTDSEAFVWTVGTAQPFLLGTPPAPAPALPGQSLTYTATGTGGRNVRYRWYFDDGTPETAWSSSATVSHAFSRPGIYYVTVTGMDDAGIPQAETLVQMVHLPLTPRRPTASGSIAVESRAGANDRLWVVNPDNDSVSVLDMVTHARLAEIPVGAGPRSLAMAADGQVWVSSKEDSSLSVINPANMTVARRIALPRGSQPFGLAMAPPGGAVFVALEGTGQLLKLDTASYAELARAPVGPNPRHVAVNGAGTRVYVSRYLTPPQPGEDGAGVQPTRDGQPAGGEVLSLNAGSLAVEQVTVLRHSDRPDFENQGSGVPNYLGPLVLSPDGESGWVPSKQDNIGRGTLRNGSNLNFQNTVRAISSRVDIGTGLEDYAARLDHDNAGVASAAVFDELGLYLFVALETSREVAVVDAHAGYEMFRVKVGRAPQGLAISLDDKRLYVSNFMDRSVTVLDVRALVDEGITSVPQLAELPTVGTERLNAAVLQGKQLFYDAADPRLARDAYLSCATCHNEGGHDGRVWDLTGLGEGLRNTTSLKGRAAGQGPLHWSGNFDEVQDFEGQIRTLAGGQGLMSDAQFGAGTRNQPLGDPKAGVSPALDALAAYVASLDRFAPSPLRGGNGALTPAAEAGREVFRARNCAACHGGPAFTRSGSGPAPDVGTLQASSGARLGGTLAGIDIPTLRDAWATAPYLHDGSAPDLAAAIRAHRNVTVSEGEMPGLVAYVAQIGSEEGTAPEPAAPPEPAPAPQPDPDPDPDPDPVPSPTPAPAPVPSPEPSPVPTPAPGPILTDPQASTPAPVQSGSGGDATGDGSGGGGGGGALDPLALLALGALLAYRRRRATI